MTLFTLALASLRNRLAVAVLTILSIALAVFLLVSVEKIREGARASLANSLGGADLIVGPPTSDVALLLHAVFHIGEPTKPIPVETTAMLEKRREVSWAVPIALGDGHRGDRVVGTTAAYFEHIETGRGEKLAFERGRVFAGPREIVLGAKVASRHGYEIGRRITLSHGTGEIDFSGRHEEDPLEVIGILAPTGTPVDRSLFVSLGALRALHGDDQGRPAEEIVAGDTITAVLVGLRTPRAAFLLQRVLASNENGATAGILPGLALARLWAVLERAETALLAVSWLVVAVSCLGLAVTVLASLEGRRREMAVLRAAGAGPGDILALLITEAVIVTAIGIPLGMVAAYGIIALAQPLLMEYLAVPLVLTPPGWRELGYLAIVAAAALAASAIPAWRAYRTSLADGLTVRT